MSYIGNIPATSFETVQKQISTSNSGTTITLDRAVTSVQDILLTIDAVVQSYDNYSVSGTTLTVGGTLSNNRVEILYVGRTMQSVDPTDDSVSASKIKTDAVTTAKVQNDAITVDKLNLISTSSVPSLEAKGDGGSQDGYIQLNCSQNSHGVKLKSPPHSANQSYTLTLPSTAPATDKILQTNSSGVLSFVDAPGGSLVYLGGVNASNHNSNKIQLQQVFSSDYQRYKLMAAFQGTSAGAVVEFRWLKSDNTEFTTGVYHTIIQGRKSDSSSSSVENNFDWGRGNSQVILDQATGSHIHKFTLDLFPNQNDNVNYPTAMGNFYSWLHNSAANKQFSGTIGLYTETTTSVAGGGIQLEATSGLFGTVNVGIWGYKDS